MGILVRGLVRRFLKKSRSSTTKPVKSNSKILGHVDILESSRKETEAKEMSCWSDSRVTHSSPAAAYGVLHIGSKIETGIHDWLKCGTTIAIPFSRSLELCSAMAPIETAVDASSFAFVGRDLTSNRKRISFIFTAMLTACSPSKIIQLSL